jgi:hypothetical protein
MVEKEEGNIADSEEQVPHFAGRWPLTTVRSFVASMIGELDDCGVYRGVQIGKG